MRFEWEVPAAKVMIADLYYENQLLESALKEAAAENDQLRAENEALKNPSKDDPVVP